ncbi:hypothetical protein P171DRAFT_496120 [Karstenula rhodostoma CBS 690.94]|uniref:Uncharacterized protein n=1 Tax=Karstenula rhodostoma CBS 690.94 TaxID=1392251 RepID=A0A9P4PD74_9PLEO|nr:hypothetical protein P171DRAFT_496120 [Karstenula rhodostoma CBS 690.94]
MPVKLEAQKTGWVGCRMHYAPPPPTRRSPFTPIVNPPRQSRHTITTPNHPLSIPANKARLHLTSNSLMCLGPACLPVSSHPSPAVLMSIIRKTSITVTHMDMPSPTPLTWDVRYTVKNPSTQVPDWHPTAWRRTLLQRLKFLQSNKQKTYAKGNAARELNREIDWLRLVRETDNVGRKDP